MKVEFKNAKQSDIDLINELIHASKAHWDYDKNFLNMFMEKFKITKDFLQRSLTMLVVVDDAIKGVCGFYCHDDGTLELDNFFLHPDCMGKGFGRKMWGFCCEMARRLGKKDFIIWADPNSESFYRKMGCVKIGVRQSPMDALRFPPVMKFVL